MFGDSCYGATQWAAVSLRHPALKAIAPGAPARTASARTHGPRRGEGSRRCSA
ncbi:hypothetical protein ACIPSJ_46125 [Streptomyces sp. NPDC090088]|uniref:hypothetical protein n=1 Tax=Streptomyces sp. NPDC090088 TaxID=3365944 RepID=UPI00380BF08F